MVRFPNITLIHTCPTSFSLARFVQDIVSKPPSPRLMTDFYFAIERMPILPLSLKSKFDHLCQMMLLLLKYPVEAIQLQLSHTMWKELCWWCRQKSREQQWREMCQPSSLTRRKKDTVCQDVSVSRKWIIPIFEVTLLSCCSYPRQHQSQSYGQNCLHQGHPSCEASSRENWVRNRWKHWVMKDDDTDELNVAMFVSHSFKIILFLREKIETDFGNRHALIVGFLCCNDVKYHALKERRSQCSWQHHFCLYTLLTKDFPSSFGPAKSNNVLEYSKAPITPPKTIRNKRPDSNHSLHLCTEAETVTNDRIGMVP